MVYASVHLCHGVMGVVCFCLFFPCIVVVLDPDLCLRVVPPHWGDGGLWVGGLVWFWAIWPKVPTSPLGRVWLGGWLGSQKLDRAAGTITVLMVDSDSDSCDVKFCFFQDFD